MSMSASGANRAASIRQRLLDGARTRGEDFQFVLDRFAVERLLYRLSISTHRDQFVLKGAMLFALWFPQPHRPTRDADFLGFGAPDPLRLAEIARELCAIDSEDGLAFDPASVAVDGIRDNASYAGLRLRLVAHLGNARCHVQWDVGFGDAVTPAPAQTAYPVLLEDMPAPLLRVYPRETVFAEKLEAIAMLGIANSRMKDYFDLLALVREGVMDRSTLATAIHATFARRGTPLFDDVPFGLTESFANDPGKQSQWNAFLRRSRLTSSSLGDVVREIRDLVRELNLSAAGR